MGVASPKAHITAQDKLRIVVREREGGREGEREGEREREEGGRERGREGGWRGEREKEGGYTLNFALRLSFSSHTCIYVRT